MIDIKSVLLFGIVVLLLFAIIAEFTSKSLKRYICGVAIEKYEDGDEASDQITATEDGDEASDQITATENGDEASDQITAAENGDGDYEDGDYEDGDEAGYEDGDEAADEDGDEAGYEVDIGAKKDGDSNVDANIGADEIDDENEKKYDSESAIKNINTLIDIYTKIDASKLTNLESKTGEINNKLIEYKETINRIITLRRTLKEILTNLSYQIDNREKQVTNDNSTAEITLDNCMYAKDEETINMCTTKNIEKLEYNFKLFKCLIYKLFYLNTGIKKIFNDFTGYKINANEMELGILDEAVKLSDDKLLRELSCHVTKNEYTCENGKIYLNNVDDLEKNTFNDEIFNELCNEDINRYNPKLKYDNTNYDTTTSTGTTYYQQIIGGVVQEGEDAIPMGESLNSHKEAITACNDKIHKNYLNHIINKIKVLKDYFDHVTPSKT